MLCFDISVNIFNYINCTTLEPLIKKRHHLFQFANLNFSQYINLVEKRICWFYPNLIHFDAINSDDLIFEKLEHHRKYCFFIIKTVDAKLTKKQFVKFANEVFITACCFENLEMLKLLYKVYKITKKQIDKTAYNMALQNACDKNHFNIVKYLHKSFDLTKKNVLDYGLKYMCIVGNLDAVKFFVKTYNLTKKDIINYYAFVYACDGKRVNVIEYLIDEFKLTKNDKLDTDNDEEFNIEEWCQIENADIEVIKCLCEKLKLTSKDIQKNNNAAIKNALNIIIVQYLLEKVKFNKHEMCEIICEVNKMEIIQFLIKKYCITKQDVEKCDRNFVLKHVCKNIDVAKYFIENFGFTKKEITEFVSQNSQFRCYHKTLRCLL